MSMLESCDILLLIVIIADRPYNTPSARHAIVSVALERPPSCANSLNYSSLLAIARLNSLRSRASIQANDSKLSWYLAYLEASLIKVVYALVTNAERGLYTHYQLTEGSLAIIRSIKTRYKA